jgi:hypothetical protein
MHGSYSLTFFQQWYKIKMLRSTLACSKRALIGSRWLAGGVRSLHDDKGSLADGKPKTVVAVLYPGKTAGRQPKLLASAENGLGIREWLESQARKKKGVISTNLPSLHSARAQRGCEDTVLRGKLAG